jgi:hypothetical protein
VLVAPPVDVVLSVIHHTKKTGGAAATVEDGRGAVALLAAVRSAQVLNKMTPEEATKAGVASHRGYFKVENGKANLAASSEGQDWYQIVSVRLGNGVGGLLDDSDNVGVAIKWRWPDPLEGVTGADFEAVAKIIRAGRWRESIQANDWVGHAVAEALNLDFDNKRDKAKAAGLVKIWIKRGMLVVVAEPDEKRMMRKYVQVADAA